MSIETGRVVKAIAGHDAEDFFAVVSADGKYVMLANGRRRTLEKPKRKSIRHVRATNTQLDQTSLTTNKKLREALAAFRTNEGGKLLV